MARRSELVELRTENISFNAETGDGVALIRNAKAGREESRYLSLEAVKHLRAWMALAQIESGPVFRRFANTGNIGHAAMAPHEVARIIQRVGVVLNALGDPNQPVWPKDHIAAQESGMARMLRAKVNVSS